MLTLKPTGSGTLEIKQMSGQPNPDMFRNTLHLSLQQYRHAFTTKTGNIFQYEVNSTLRFSKKVRQKKLKK